MAKKDKENPPPPPPDKPLKFACGKCQTEYGTLADALACPCRSGGEP